MLGFVIRFHMKFLRGISTIETMVMMLAIGLVILASYSARQSAFQTYQEMIHRERALLFATETLEQFEVMRLTRQQQDYIRSWDLFLGNKEDGQYQFVLGDHLSEINLLRLSDEYELSDEDESMIRYYDEEAEGLFTRLERRIFVETLDADQKRVTVSAYWGEPGFFEDDGRKQVRLQALYFDQVQSGFAI